MHRILLVELAVIGRYHRAVQFPYLAGLLSSLGAPYRWLRFAVPPEGAEHGEGVELAPVDLETLRAAVDHFRPERVVLSRSPAPSMIAVATATAHHVHVLGDTYAAAGRPDRVVALSGGVGAWRELAGAAPEAGPQPGGDGIAPSFAYEPANAAAATLEPLPFLVFGAECTYDRPLSSHPLYRDLDLSSCVRTGGCAFCNRPPHGPGASFREDDARAQLQALRDTLPPHAGRLSVRLVGEPAISHVETIASLVRALGLAPADWLLDTRADRLVTYAPALERACSTLEGSGHKLHVALVGIESFVGADLELLNKGTRPLQNLDAAWCLLRLERAHPDSFSFRTFGGLSTIFFTPWTTLEDLATNLRVIQQCGLSSVAGKVLGDRLRLEPGLPITLLARRDGLVVERYDDVALDTAARNFYGAELPWRFRDRRVEPLGRILVRLRAAASGKPVGDALGARVADWWGALAERRFDVIDAALLLVDRVESMGLAADGALEGIASPEAILDGCDASGGRSAVVPGADQQRGKVGGAAECALEGPRDGESGGRFGWATHLVALCRAGLKPVSKVEPLSPEEAEELVRELQPPHPRTRLFDSASGRQVAHVFFGESEGKVEEAIAWTARGEHDPSDEARNRAVAEAGKLLGYPACCAEAFAFEETPRSRLSYGWMHLARRVGTPGPVDPILNPWGAALFESYVPCSLGCFATLQLLRKAERVVREAVGDASMDRMLASCGRPWLVVLAGQGSALELIPQTAPGERFRYAAGRHAGDAGPLARAMDADEIVLEDERLRLLRKGSLAADLSLRAFVWWHERALQAELWTRVLGMRELLGGDHHGGGRSALDVDGGLRLGPQMVALQKLLSSALAELGKSGRLQRIEVVRLRPVSAGLLSLELSVAGRVIELYVADAAQTRQAALRIGPFAIMRPGHQTLDDAVHKAAVQALGAQLAAWVAARQRAVRRRGG